MTDIYIAARSQDRNKAIEIAKALSSNGFNVISRWLKDGGLAVHHKELSKEEACRFVANQDLADLKRSDILVAFLPTKFKSMGTGGRHFEFGVAYALNKPIVILGNRGNVFHYLAGVDRVDTTEKLVYYLKSESWKHQIKSRC